MKLILLSIALVISQSGVAFAHNNLFFPGDAFFSAEFGAKFFEDAPKGDELLLEYERLTGEDFTCGYLGYANLQVNAVPKKTLSNLRAVHRLIYEKLIVEETEQVLRPASIFVYNRDFPLSSPFGVKYNEHWVEIQEGEAKATSAIYDSLGSDRFVIDDWAAAETIPPLAITDGRAAMVDEEGNGQSVTEPLQIEASRVMFVVLADNDVSKFARREEGMIFFVITEKVARYRFDREGIAMPQPAGAPKDEVVSQRKKIAADQAALRAALTVYRSNFATLPSKEQGLAALLKKPSAAAPEGWMPLLKKLPVDPWLKPYSWDGDVIFSLGADGVESKDDVVEPYLLTEDGVVIPPPARGG